MGVFGGPNVSEDGLVLALDGANFKSFKGEATTNLIPNPTVNAYPTTGNGWGTYNTNQYNGAQYFSIGSISNVSGNVITTSGNHPLRTYDAVMAQSTGGGVNAGTVYFIKKVSDTSFTLHEYNGSQDGSQGYINPSTGNHKVYDSIANDTRISVNSTSFPTMWWGSAHLPNSGLVKELRYGEFNAIPNLPANDCIRLHYIRTDDVKDGMSYGIDASVTAGSPVTVSFYTRSVNANAVGKAISYQIYNYTGGSAAGYGLGFTLGAVGVWERQTLTFTPAYGTIISYWFSGSGGVYSWDWSCMQVEQKSYLTSFVAGTRGTTVATGGGWADLIGNGNHGELVNGVRENSNNGGSLSFDGSNARISIPNSASNNILGNITLECWVNRNTNVGGVVIHKEVQYTLSIDTNGTITYADSSLWSYATFGFHGNVTANIFNHIIATKSGSLVTIYINGNVVISQNFGSAISQTSNILYIGSYDGSSSFFNGRIANAKIYNRALTAQEVSQNYNALRRRFEDKVFYNEGSDARNFVSNWNDQEIFNMTTTADLGNCYIHGWGGSPRSYTLTLTNLPTHTEVKYECYIHMVDSLDNETSEIYTRNSAGTESLAVRWTKQYNQVPNVSTLASGMLFPFKTGQTYSYRPWGNGAYGNDGYASFDTGFYAHTGSNFSIRHYLGADQGSNDEAYYISHVKLTIRY